MLVSDRRRLSRQPLVELAREAARSGVDWIQVREKDLADGALLRVASDVRQAVEAAQTKGTAPSRVLVNGRPDIAQAAGAHGVQLPEEGLPVAAVRRAFPGLAIGASCHSIEAARRAEEEGADWVVLGPVFSTPGKEHHPLGLERLAQAVRELRVPVYAIGGIDLANAPRALAAGASGLAAIRLFVDAPPPLGALVRRLKAGPIA
jgi:thiamine-phosphate pyrophosphorylase